MLRGADPDVVRRPEALAGHERRVQDSLARVVEATQDDEGGAGRAEVRGSRHEVEALVVRDPDVVDV